MDSVNTFLSGFKTITTPYDKVDHKARNIQNIINLIGGAEKNETPEEAANAEAETASAQANEGAASANGTLANKDKDKDIGEVVNDKADPSFNTPQSNAEPEETEEKEGIIDFLKKRTLKAAKAGEAERTTELPEGTYIMENIIRIGTVIIYILLLPLIPWYYVMKYSFRKMRHLYDNMFKQM